MKNIPINKEVILARVSEIEKDLDRLSRFKDFSIQEFKENDNFAVADHYLRRAFYWSSYD